MKRKMAVLLVLLALVVCSVSAAGPKTIAFSIKVVDNPYQGGIAEEIQKGAEAAGYKFVISVAGGQTNVSTQVNQLEDLIAKKVDGIIFSPMDSNAVIPAMRKAKAAGIPVILVDTPVDRKYDDLYVCYVGTDNFNAGVEAGKKMVKLLNGAGKVLIVRGANGSAAGDLRVDGFKKGIQGSNVKVANEQVGNWLNVDAMQAMENMLQSNKDADGVFSASDVMLDGILQAIKDNGKKGLKIMSVDGSMVGVKHVQAGDVVGTMAQFPHVIGEIAVKKMVDILEKRVKASDVPKIIDSGTAVFEMANIDEALKKAF